MSCGQCGVFHFGLGRTRSWSNEYYLSFYIITSVLPCVILIFPLLALVIQLCGAHSPLLDYPHSNTALIMILFMLLFLASRAPHDIYEQMKMFSVEYGERVDIMHRVMCRPIARSSAAREASDAGSCGVENPQKCHDKSFLFVL